MGAIQEIFKRVEKKYIVTDEQQEELVRAMTGRAAADNYGLTTICNIYYDTPDHQLIRTSMEKPVYKEKLRIRSYGVPDKDSKVFVELKKKYKGVVYKRRVDMSLIDSYEFVNFGVNPGKNPQIEKEIEYFLKYYRDIAPAMYLSYDRIAFAGVDNPDLRITFDGNITYREDEVRLEKGVWGDKLLDPHTRIMEIKIPGAMPLWLSRLLDDMKIYPGSFSKYGEAYKRVFSEAQDQEKYLRLNCENLKGKVNDCA
ncbi:polyphosphate polymerase domain-containing protein [Ruminococcus albus]|uniref:VTC domain-containing protein n=1 Tax=Ruminococcus albus TaxID=1264 RepID=A0A1H7MAJ8_RUMAL|nr:polyphosphate polymerase domain-containing protein [Ruminococcus albus]SEL08172.1 VTC domain-containing protein [Ruminococcus albus]